MTRAEALERLMIGVRNYLGGAIFKSRLAEAFAAVEQAAPEWTRLPDGDVIEIVSRK